jgi:hypothetical protein
MQKVEKRDGESFAKNLNVPFMEASAKSGEKVEEAFLKLVKEVKRRLIDKGPDSVVCICISIFNNLVACQVNGHDISAQPDLPRLLWPCV